MATPLSSLKFVVEQSDFNRATDTLGILEITYEVFSHLEAADLGRCTRVSHTWRDLALTNYRQRIKESAFGKKKWCDRFKICIQEEPALPLNILHILNQPCPFEKGKKVYETHVLSLVPNRIKELPLNLDSLKKHIETIDPPLHAYINGLDESVYVPHLPRPYWILMTKNILEGSLGKHFFEQQELLAEKGGPAYFIPRVLEAAVTIITHFNATKERLYETTYTSCLEAVGDTSSTAYCGLKTSGHIIVGEYLLSNGFFVNAPSDSFFLAGVGALRILKDE